MSRGKCTRAKDYHRAIWDQKITDKEYFTELFRVSKNQIIWGINYFVSVHGLKIGSGRIFWDKVNGDTNFSDGEIAYSSFHYSVRLFRFMWSGMMQGASINKGAEMNGFKHLNEKRIHPTQKPVALYKWLLDKYAKPGDKILDTHMGSGSIAIACVQMGFDLTACELDKDYFDAAMKRIELNTMQLKIF